MLTIWCARWLMVAAFAMVEYSTLKGARQKREPAHQSLLSRLQRYASSVSHGLAVEMLVHSAGDAVRCICDGAITPLHSPMWLPVTCGPTANDFGGLTTDGR